MLPPQVVYNPSQKTVEARTETYKDIEDMIQVRNTKYRQLNSGEVGDRNLVQYWDDSDKRVNGYTPTREEQEKESWQSNFFHHTTRNKLKAFIAGVALNVPEFIFKAVNKSGVFSSKRAEAIKQLVKHSRIAHGNPQMDVFFEAWEAAVKGTVIKYDGYLKTTYKRKYIKSYDVSTGESEFEEREELVDDKPLDLLVPLSEFFVTDIRIFDVQDQPAVAWIQHYNRRQLEQEFSKFANYQYLKDKDELVSFGQRFTTDTQTYYYDKWSQRVTAKDDFEVIRYYNKEKDQYQIWINGVDMQDTPLLWGKRDKKYPFAKTIFEPFEGMQFFYGKSFPHVMEGVQDTDNTVINSVLDKMYRSLKPPMLIGLANKDLMDLEDELVNEDNKIYVPDVSQVKPFPYNGVDNSDIAMLEVVARMADMTSATDPAQQGVQGQGVTAREVLIADEHARKLKGIFFMFLEDLWLQKTRLRINTILTHYMQPKLIPVAGEEGAGALEEAMNIMNVPEVEFSDGTVGTLGIQIAQGKDGRTNLRKQGVAPQDLLSVPQIEAREQIAKDQGINYKLVAMTSDYLDDWGFDFVVVPASLFAQEQSKDITFFEDKMQKMMTIFPEYLASNKEKEFRKFVELYGESVDDYNPPVQQAPMEEDLLGLNNEQNNAPTSIPAGA